MSEQDVNAWAMGRIARILSEPEWTPDTLDEIAQAVIDAGYSIESDDGDGAEEEDAPDAESHESPRAEGEATPAPAWCPSCGGGGPVADRYPDAAAILCDRCNTDCRR